LDSSFGESLADSVKILMASHYFASHKGGVEIVAEALFHAFTDNGLEVVWMASDATAPPEPLEKSRAVSLPVFNFVEEKTGLPFPIPKIGALRRIVREVGNADILILHDCLYLSNIFAFLAALRHRVPTVIIQHIGFIPYANYVPNAVMRLANAIVTRPMLSRASQVVFISETTRKFFAQLRFRRTPEVIFNGVNTELFHRPGASETVPKLRRKFGLPEDGTVILFVGRFVEKKGISVMKRMANLRRDWTWVFAGWGSLDPTSWNATNVRVFSDLWGSSMAALYRCCDLLVLPSTGEGFPLVIQEALATGLLVVCGEETLTADPAMGEFVKGAPVLLGEDDKTAIEFLSAIDDMFSSEARMNDRSEERRAFAVSRYSWRRATERYMEIISRLVPQTASNALKSEVGTKEKRP
jgi:glycosyltransferase involved in cell wall biosynthesis